MTTIITEHLYIIRLLNYITGHSLQSNYGFWDFSEVFAGMTPFTVLIVDGLEVESDGGCLQWMVLEVGFYV